MRIQGLFSGGVLHSLFALFACGLISGFVVTQARATCFDFSKHVTKSLRPPSILPDVASPHVATRGGRIGSGGVWAAARGEVERPIEEVIDAISRHVALKSKRIDKMKVTPRGSSGGYLLRQKVDYSVKPFLFVTVDWSEDWAFALNKGSPRHPQQVTVLYQKSEGTSHIRHLCGSMVLRKITPKKTDVFFYEEADATGRSEKDEVKGLIGNLRSLRYGHRSG